MSIVQFQGSLVAFCSQLAGEPADRRTVGAFDAMVATAIGKQIWVPVELWATQQQLRDVGCCVLRKELAKLIEIDVVHSC